MEAARYVHGVAVHWYLDGLVPAETSLGTTHHLFPEYYLFGTEACAGWSPLDRGVKLGSWERAERYAASILQVGLPLGDRAPETGPRRQGPGDRGPETGARRQGPGDRAPETGTRRQGPGDRDPETGARRQGPGDRDSETGPDWWSVRGSKAF